MLRGVHATCRLNVLSAVCAPPPVGRKQLSVARTVKVKVPGEEGLPVIKPVGLMLSPAGSDPPTILNEIGNCPPEVCICREYPSPTVAEGKGLVVVMPNAGQLTVTFVETGNGAKAETQPATGGGGAVSTVTVYDPVLGYVCGTIQGAVQFPILVNGSDAENLI